MKPIIVVHGGAGQWNSEQMLKEAVNDCRKAAAVGQDLLLSGATAVEAVEAAVRVLEDSPVLDAGRGSYLTQQGEIELDALIMDGATLQLGAVASVQRILHPISLARRLLTDSRHNFLVASGAEAFADETGFPRCRFEDLLAPDSLRQVAALPGGGRTSERQHFAAIGLNRAEQQTKQSSLAATVGSHDRNQFTRFDRE